MEMFEQIFKKNYLLKNDGIFNSFVQRYSKKYTIFQRFGVGHFFVNIFKVLLTKLILFDQK